MVLRIKRIMNTIFIFMTFLTNPLRLGKTFPYFATNAAFNFLLFSVVANPLFNLIV